MVKQKVNAPHATVSHSPKSSSSTSKSTISNKAKSRKLSTGSTSTAKKSPTPLPSLLSLFPEYRKQKYSVQVTGNRTQLIGELKRAYLHRGLVLYLGAGVSRSIGLPSWPELIRSLTVTMMSRKVSSAIDALEGLSEEKRWMAISAIQEDVVNEADYDKPILMMARAIKDEFGESLPQLLSNNLYRSIRRYILRARLKKLPKGKKGVAVPVPDSPLLNSIVALARAERDVSGVQAIVNYNFDDLVEEKLREQNVRCKPVLSGRDQVPPGTLPCYHVHGVLPFQDYVNRSMLKSTRRIEAKGNFVFSEDEYHAEYSDAYRWSNMTQMSLLGRYTGLFVGLSMEDPNIRRLIDVTHRQYPEISNYAILARRRSLARSKDTKQGVLRNLFEGVETASFAKIGVKVIWVDDYGDIPDVLGKICDVDSA